MCLKKFNNLTPLFKQTLVVSSVLCAMMGHGMTMGVTSSMLPALQDPASPIKASLEQVSWLVASLAVGSVLSFTIFPILMSTFGRRVSMMVAVLPAILGYVISYCASDITALIAGRFLNGLTLGPTGVIGAVVIGEYTSPTYRGVFLNLKTAALFIGVTMVHVLSYYLHWKTVCLTCTVPFTVSGVVAYTWPESPSWLVAQRDYAGCVKSFYWLRGKSNISTVELQRLIAAQRAKAVIKNQPLIKQISNFLQKFKRKNFLEPVIIFFFAAVVLETNGRHIFPSYALQIVSDMTETKSQSFYYTLCLDLISTGSAILASFLVKIYKRRILLFTTGLTSLVILIGVCIFLFLQSNGDISKDYNWIALMLFGLYFVLVNLGCSPIPLALVGELFPLEHRATGSFLSGAIISVILIIIFKATPIMLTSLKVYGTFAVYGGIMAVALAVLYFILPETKDRTLQDIEDGFDTRVRSAELADGDNHAIELSSVFDQGREFDRLV